MEIMFKKLKNKRFNEIKADFGNEGIVKMSLNANLFGILSKGVKQIRGNGVLALTDHHLVFYMWTPKRKIVIRRNQIQTVEVVNHFLKKIRLGQKVLKISYLNDEGSQDAIGLMIRDIEDWVTILK